jgi:hypothetical protein
MSAQPLTPQPLTPQQALDHFRLLLELSARNSYEDYRAAVCEIANTVLERGIAGDARHRGATSGAHFDLLP